MNTRKKLLIKRTADMLEKLGIAGMAIGLFHARYDTIWLSLVFVAISYAFTYWEGKQ